MDKLTHKHLVAIYEVGLLSVLVSHVKDGVGNPYLILLKTIKRTTSNQVETCITVSPEKKNSNSFIHVTSIYLDSGKKVLSFHLVHFEWKF